MQEFGYEKERFSSNIGDQFDCPICQNVARFPKECTTCGSIFCTSCIDSWMTKKKECINRCDSTKTEIKPIGPALRRIYNNIEIKCRFFDKCNRKVLMTDLELHEKNCQKPKCKNYDVCASNCNDRFGAEQVCDLPCLLFMRIRANASNPTQQLAEIKNFLQENYASQLANTQVKTFVQSSILPPNGTVQQQLVQAPIGGHYFRWSTKNKGTGIELSNNNLNVWLKESAYMFRTIIGDTPFNSGVHYWEIFADERTENELKIGISTKEEFNYNSAFCDYDHGFSFYGLGQLRHNSNASGPQYGKRFKKEGVLGICLNMNKGQMSFSLNGEFLGIAYNSESLKRGPIFAAVSLLHCAGCRLDASKPVPAIFPL